jgi:hypothetical protein
MASPDDNHTKVLFRFYSDVMEREMVETMWAKTIDKDKGLYQLASIPFYAPNLALGDLVRAEHDAAEGMLTYREICGYSGHSTLQVAILDKATVTNDIRGIFETLGCSSEKFKEGYFVIDVPDGVDYRPIKGMLNDLSGKGIIDYAEACLAEGHRQQINS